MSKRVNNKKGGLRKGVANTHPTKLRGGTALRKPTRIEMAIAKMKADALAQSKLVMLPAQKASTKFADENGVRV